MSLSIKWISLFIQFIYSFTCLFDSFSISVPVVSEAYPRPYAPLRPCLFVLFDLSSSIECVPLFSVHLHTLAFKCVWPRCFVPSAYWDRGWVSLWIQSALREICRRAELKQQAGMEAAGETKEGSSAHQRERGQKKRGGIRGGEDRGKKGIFSV